MNFKKSRRYLSLVIIYINTYDFYINSHGNEKKKKAVGERMVYIREVKRSTKWPSF